MVERTLDVESQKTYLLSPTSCVVTSDKSSLSPGLIVAQS